MPFGDCKRRNLSMDRADRRTWPFNRELLDNSHNEVRKIPSAPIATLFPLKTGQPLSTVAAHPPLQRPLTCNGGLRQCGERDAITQVRLDGAKAFNRQRR